MNIIYIFKIIQVKKDDGKGPTISFDLVYLGIKKMSEVKTVVYVCQ